MQITRETIKGSLRQIEEYYDYSHADNDYHILVKLEEVTDLIYDLLKATENRYRTDTKEIPLKPHFYDTKFRHLGRTYGELVDIQQQYNCPRCNSSLWLDDKFNRCTNCGQALNWSECKYSEHLGRWI